MSNNIIFKSDCCKSTYITQSDPNGCNITHICIFCGEPCDIDMYSKCCKYPISNNKCMKCGKECVK